MVNAVVLASYDQVAVPGYSSGYGRTCGGSWSSAKRRPGYCTSSQNAAPVPYRSKRSYVRVMYDGLSIAPHSPIHSPPLADPHRDAHPLGVYLHLVQRRLLRETPEGHIAVGGQRLGVDVRREYRIRVGCITQRRDRVRIDRHRLEEDRRLLVVFADGGCDTLVHRHQLGLLEYARRCRPRPRFVEDVVADDRRMTAQPRREVTPHLDELGLDRAGAVEIGVAVPVVPKVGERRSHRRRAVLQEPLSGRIIQVRVGKRVALWVGPSRSSVATTLLAP